jgi:hypothetical protein
MRISNVYYFLTNEENVRFYYEPLSEINNVVKTCPVSFSRSNPAKIKSYFENNLNKVGWVNAVQIDNRIKATINFMKMDVGFVLQLGNVARIYADLIKFNYLYDKGILKLGIIGVASRANAKLLGANYANYERVVDELEVYKNILPMPLIIYGLAN